MFDLSGKTALVTGASGGIGGAIARTLHRQGATVTLSGTRAEALEQLKSSLGERAHVVAARMDDAADIDRLAKEAEAAMGKLDILVNNAGILRQLPITEMTLAEFKQVFDINAVGCWLGMKNAVEPMKANGGGSIVNISSIEGLTGAAHCTAYAASKFAIRGMTKAAAQELGGFGIRVNSVHPGGIVTSMIFQSAETLDPDRGQRYFDAMPLGRFGKSIEVSHLVAFLASDDSSYCTGSEFIADGGILSGPGY